MNLNALASFLKFEPPSWYRCHWVICLMKKKIFFLKPRSKQLRTLLSWHVESPSKTLSSCLSEDISTSFSGNLVRLLNITTGICSECEIGLPNESKLASVYLYRLFLIKPFIFTKQKQQSGVLVSSIFQTLSLFFCTLAQHTTY